MKTKNIILIGLIGALLCGCIIKSLHPFYFEKDVVFKKELLGSWLDQDSSRWEVEQGVAAKGFLRSGDSLGNFYKVTIPEKDGTVSVLEAHLFHLGGSSYLDFYPQDLDIKSGILAQFHLVGAHSLAKCTFINSTTIKVSWFNEGWLSGLFEQNRIRIAHEEVENGDDDLSYVLTASTAELQKFILKYGNDPKAFEPNDSYGNKGEDIMVFTLRKLK